MAPDFQPPTSGDSGPGQAEDPNRQTIAPLPNPLTSGVAIPKLASIGASAGLAIAVLIVADRLSTFSVGLLLVVTAIVGAQVAFARFVASTWGDASLTLPRHTIRLGENFAVDFHQEINNPSKSAQAKITAATVCSEWVRYNSGSSTHTRTSAVWRSELVSHGGPRPSDGADLRASFQVTIPADLPPSFELRDNRLRWMLEVRVATPSFPDAKHFFPFTVVPEYWDGDVRTAPPSLGGFRPPSPGFP